MAQLSDDNRGSLLDDDEESPVQFFPAEGGSPYVIVCDHAGRQLPRKLGDLGLSPTDLESHIAWDIGALGVARKLGAELNAPVFSQRYSRLVIDCNRPLIAADSVPVQSGGIAIPGNYALTAAQLQQRADEIFFPYHQQIQQALDARCQPYVLISMHSFTPELYGVARPYHAGVLYCDDARLARPLLELLRADQELVVGDNAPYTASADTDYAIIEYGEKRGAPYVELEVRQDLIGDEVGESLWAQRLACALRLAAATLGLN